MNFQRAGEQLATQIGQLLQQEFHQINGVWWLYTLGKAARELRPDEVEWHTARNHKPFCPDGLDPDHPDWWKDPKPSN